VPPRPRVVRIDARHLRQHEQRPIDAREQHPGSIVHRHGVPFDERRLRGERIAHSERPSALVDDRAVLAFIQRPLRQAAGERVARVDRAPDAAVEELVLPDTLDRAHVVPKLCDVRVAAHGPVDPVVVLRLDPRERRAARRLHDPMPAVLDDRAGDDEVRRDEQYEHHREAARHEHQQACRHEAHGERNPTQGRKIDPAVLDPPPRQQAERVGERGRVDEAPERDRDRQDAGDERRSGKNAPRADDDATLGEREQRDQPERRDVEHVALFDPA
jgi:hypothetical protein